MTTRIPLLLFPMLALAASVEAQTSEWTGKVKPGTAIFVTTLTGEEIAGKAGPAAPGTLTVLTPAGARVVALNEMQTVQQHDRPWTGAVGGGLFGMTLALVAATSAATECPPRDALCKNDPVALGVISYTAVGALAGWGIDMLVKKRRTIYDSRPRPRASLFIRGRMAGLAIAF